MTLSTTLWGTARHGAYQPLSRATLCRSETFWLRYDPGRKRWLDRAFVEPFNIPADTLACWLTEQAGRYEVELRVGTSGQHAGVWLGLTAIGATPREAARLAKLGSRTVEDSMEGFRWNVKRCQPPMLPRQRRCLHGVEDGRPLEFIARSMLTPHITNQLALRGSPLVLRFRLFHRQCFTDLFEQAALLRDLAIAQEEGEHAALRAARLMDRAASLEARISVHGRRLPGDIPLRMLAGSLTQDFGAALRWRAEPAALEARPRVLRALIHLVSMSGKDARRAEHDLPF